MGPTEPLTPTSEPPILICYSPQNSSVVIRDAKYPDETPNEGDLVRSGCDVDLTVVRVFLLYLRKASTRGTFLKVFSGVESFCFGLRVSGIGPRRFRFRLNPKPCRPGCGVRGRVGFVFATAEIAVHSP